MEIEKFMRRKERKPLIIGVLLPKNKRVRFSSLEEASLYTHISVKRIQHCIATGQKWWQWIFDEEI